MPFWELPAILAKQTPMGRLLGAAKFLAPAALDLFGRSQQNKAMRAEARRAEAFGERMSSTAAQRSFADYQAAGLNPALAYDRTASSPSGVVGQVENVMSGAISSAQQAAMNRASLQNVQAQLVSAQNAAKISGLEAAKQDDLYKIFTLLTRDGQKGIENDPDFKRFAGSTVYTNFKEGLDAAWQNNQATAASARSAEANAELSKKQLEDLQGVTFGGQNLQKVVDLFAPFLGPLGNVLSNMVRKPPTIIKK